MPSSISTNTNATADTDLDLDEVWPSLVRECESILGQPLPQRGLDGAAFRARVNDVQNDLNGSKSKRKAWAISVAKRVSECLEQFGPIVAQGASVVFGPSEQCWNAISFVIKAAKSYREILEGFVVLLDFCAYALDRMLFYLKQASSAEKLDHHMRRPAYEFLGHFLRILAQSHKIAHSKKVKINQVMHIVLFNDDAGVKQEMEEVRELVNRFNERAWDQTLMDIKGITKFMMYTDEERKVHEEECRRSFERLEEITAATYETTWELKQGFELRETEKANRDNLKRIRDTFQLGQDEMWSRTHDKYRARRLGTAEWLKQDESYQSWKEIKPTSPKLLTVTGKRGYGKSFVCCNAIDDLSSFSRQSGLRKISVAFYYFNHSDKENCTLDRCIASIILQLAKSDQVYARDVAEACAQARPPSRPDELWEKLVLNLRKSRPRTDFIIIDDYHESDGDGSESQPLADIINLSASQRDGYSVRWLVSSTDNEFAANCDGRKQIRLGSPRWHPDQEEEDSQSTADEPVINQTDLMDFVEDGIAKICTRADLGSLLDSLEVKEKLVRGADGDYQLLVGKLNEIDSTSTRSEVRHILSRACETSVASIKRVIRRLDEDLSQREIDQLNEVLTWMVFGKGRKSIGLLRSVLLWVQNEDFQLRKQIRSKFSSLLELVDNDGEAHVNLAYQQDQVEKMLRGDSLPDDDTEASEEAMMPLQQGEINMLQHVVKVNCPDDVYARSGFDAVFKRLSSGPNKSIKLDGKSAAHAHILVTCVDALTRQQDEAEFYSLREYASHWLGEHIKGVVDPSEVGNDVLQDLGSKMAILLWDPVSINAWWDEAWLRALKNDWIKDGKNYCGALIRTLKHDQIALGFASNSENHQWLKSVLENNAPSDEILTQVAKQLMLRVMKNPNTNDRNFACAFKIMSKTLEIEPADKTSTSDLDTFMQWAKGVVGDDTTEAYWECEKGIAYWLSGFKEEALAKLEHARADFPKDIVFSSVLTELYFGFDKFQQSLECVHTLKDCHGDISNEHGPYEQWFWQTGLIMEGKCHRRLEEYGRAIACFERCIEHGPVGDYDNFEHGEAVSGLLRSLDGGNCHQQTMELIAKYNDDANRGLRYWIVRMMDVEDTETLITRAARRAGKEKEMCDIFRTVVEDLELVRVFEKQHQNEKTRHVNWLQHFYAALMFDLSDSDDDRWDAIQRWEGLVELSATSSVAQWPARLAMEKLVTALLDMILNTAQNTNMYLKCMDKLESLAHSRATIVRQAYKAYQDPRLALARLRVMQDQVEKAREIASSRLRWIFDEWTDALDEDEVAERFWQLASTLRVLNRDSDARAAFQAVKSKKQSGDDGEKAENESETTKIAESNAPGSWPSTTDADKDLSVPRTTGSTDLEPGPFSGYVCDAVCDNDIGLDMFVCKECIDVQLCPECYHKWKKGELSVALCFDHHEYLSVGPIDLAAWRKLAPDEMLVDGQAMSKQTWLDKIREEWDLRQDQIDTYKADQMKALRAGKVIATAISRYIKRKRGGSESGRDATGAKQESVEATS